ncbi:hybrid sensor histidine kinase/response regulator [Vibrio nitrifigilis]|uniref:histidine kinase n=1 Tax=Vibrio nitrifigilis TaxID=2789781 RepID=A0ABS0GFQ6_9VIBR|nr:PAS domain-containing hybrid sensor histidine kinase/response regulator [Vibrio nitrifigilis]MBF9001256.1 hybrid sensor histidine kinase/response regulator [Vibrio nitrifigilis]
MQGWLVVPVSLVYLGALFLIAWYGDRQRRWLEGWRPWIYSLSIAVYCTSWTFFGTVGQASANPWSFIPIYLAPILVFVFGWRIIARLILTAKREHITSIADFISARYGKAQGLAVVVTVIAVVGVLPYIALQLRAITTGLNVVAPELFSDLGYDDQSVSWFVVFALALFSMLFGTRQVDNTEHHRGMMIAVAFESIIKLAAFIIVGIFICYVSWNTPDFSMGQLAQISYQPPNWPTLTIHLVLTVVAIICLPRQFHTIVVENEQGQDLHTARWLFPMYLFLMSLFVLPISWVGQGLLLGNPDTFVVSIPKAVEADGIALLAFLGGASAASSMVIVSTMALAIMMSNDLVMPLLLRRMRLTQRNHIHISRILVIVRRLLILLIMLGAWGFYQVLDSIPSLSAIGFLSFAAITQFAPALLGGMYWREGNRKGAYAGLGVGFFIWLITLMNATGLLAGSANNNVLLWISTPPLTLKHWGLASPEWGMFLSVVLNALCYVVVSLVTRASLSERLQAASFVGTPMPNNDNITIYQSRVTVGELEMLAARFVGRARVRHAFEQYWSAQPERLMQGQQATASLIRHTERVLAGVFGVSSAKLVLTSALQGRNMHLEDVATIVDEASEIYDFSRGLLQGAIEHISQGLAVVDKHLRLVAWNQRYLELFNFPAGLVQVGRPIEDIIRHNAKQGLCGPGDVEEHVEKRLRHLEKGTAHTSARERPDGKVIEVQGNPMPGGGFVMSFNDITAFRAVEQSLKEANENLEERVHQRTHELETLNKQLVLATQRSEHESQSKSRFLAAVSHDLMQPLNAARLFSSSLGEIAQDKEVKQLSQHIESSLGAAEDLIGDLLDISRLESGKLEVYPQAFAVRNILDNLAAEFRVIASKQGVEFSMVPSSQYIISDQKLLRRVVQNFLTNAFRYCSHGKVLLGVRHKAEKVVIEVWDNGVGIEQEKQQEIFEEFNRGSQVRSDQGLGLGLAISKGIAQVLHHDIAMRSWVGKGSVFSVTMDKAQAPEPIAFTPETNESVHNVEYLRVLCVDNESAILDGMRELLERWGCEVKTALNLVDSLQVLEEQWRPNVILSDYRLDDGRTGLEVLQQFRLRLGDDFSGVIISADRTTEILEAVKTHGFRFIAKPVKPLKLRALLLAK